MTCDGFYVGLFMTERGDLQRQEAVHGYVSQVGCLLGQAPLCQPRRSSLPDYSLSGDTGH